MHSHIFRTYISKRIADTVPCGSNMKNSSELCNRVAQHSKSFQRLQPILFMCKICYFIHTPATNLIRFDEQKFNMYQYSIYYALRVFVLLCACLLLKLRLEFYFRLHLLDFRHKCVLNYTVQFACLRLCNPTHL